MPVRTSVRVLQRTSEENYLTIQMAAGSSSVVIAISDSENEGSPVRPAAVRRQKVSRPGPSREGSSSRPRTSSAQPAARGRSRRGMEVNLLPSNPPQVHLSGRRQGSQQDTGVVDLTKIPDEEVLVVNATTSGQKRKRKASKTDPLCPDSPQASAAAAKCGICFERMASPNRSMACGPCGHVFCEQCLRQAVKAQKKCPTCRKTTHARQIHKVYLGT